MYYYILKYSKFVHSIIININYCCNKTKNTDLHID